MFAPRGGGSGTYRLTPTRVYTNARISNLQCLCIFHHNMKTDGRLEAVPLPDGDVLFVLDGLPFRSTPEGPLSRSGRTWGTTFGDYMGRKVAA